MIRNLKALGLAVVALVAMSAVMATAASAGNFTASSYPSTLRGSQVGEHVFTTEEGNSIKCPAANFHGALNFSGSSTVSVQAEYKGAGEKQCQAFGFLSATVSMNGCTYTFHNEWAYYPGMAANGEMDIVCPKEKTITIAAGTCEIRIGGQAGLGTVYYTVDTEATPDDLTVEPKIVSTVIYMKTKDGFGCPLAGTGTGYHGSYSGNTTFIGEDPFYFEQDALGLS